MAERREAKYNRYPAWAPRFWHGMRFGDWLGLLIRNRFRIHPFRLPTARATGILTHQQRQLTKAIFREAEYRQQISPKRFEALARIYHDATEKRPTTS